MKYCPHCKKTLSLNMFSKNKSRYDGHNSYCRLCSSLRMKKYRSQPHVKKHKIIYEREYINRPKVILRRQEYALKYYYGITIKQREEIWIKQNKKCCICKKDILSWKDARIDHNHKSKKVRGLLCNDCNLLLGHAFDNIEYLYAAIEYLKNHT